MKKMIFVMLLCAGLSGCITIQTPNLRPNTTPQPMPAATRGDPIAALELREAERVRSQVEILPNARAVIEYSAADVKRFGRLIVTVPAGVRGTAQYRGVSSQLSAFAHLLVQTRRQPATMEMVFAAREARAEKITYTQSTTPVDGVDLVLIKRVDDSLPAGTMRIVIFPVEV